MSDLKSVSDDAGRRADAAVESADAAAQAAGVAVRELADLNALDAVSRLFGGIWRPQSANPPVTTELLRALAKAGNYVVGAYGNDQLLGACVGFFGAPSDGAFHSHIMGVPAVARGRSVGYALKVHQRAWALLRGASMISWTFDPLVCRNAYFNIAKLAATPVEYLTNFYGDMHDEINGDDHSDRLLLRWSLDAAEVSAACIGSTPAIDVVAERARGAETALSSSDTGAPVAGSVDAPTVLVAVPSDIETLRRSDPERAKEWRVALRDVLGGLMAAGARVSGFDRSGWYVVSTRDAPTTSSTVKEAS